MHILDTQLNMRIKIAHSFLGHVERESECFSKKINTHKMHTSESM